MDPRRILLASHGTTGARAADRAAISLCQASGVEVIHLTVVPDLWLGAMGDDWLNNVSSRESYCKHIEGELDREIEQHRLDLEPRIVAQGARYHPHVVLGGPTESLIGLAATIKPDVVVLGSPRPRGVPGLRSRLRLDHLLARISVPLLIVPHPASVS
jgi:nucleotide-binding universal stress UspA family protein